ncbi:MFS transporter [uncultured Shewanella sp.]|uniref:MFS transporter n=1 Tax=uncultured Shewanella sp. TaxID=173975 RepID=UPI00262992B7|nr:MFS transporter [uncultured Shewanella sp.]
MTGMNKNGYLPLSQHKPFHRLCLSSVISGWGDQLTIIGLPWLVLFLTDESWVLGLVLSLFSLPMSLFILFGGIVVDRFSEKKVLLSAKYINFFLLLILSMLLFFDMLTLTILSLLIFIVGVSAAFTIPAASSFLPSIVAKVQLQTANSIGISLRTVISWLGPLTAAFIIGTDKVTASTLSLVFILDAFSFLFSAIILHGIVIKSKVKKTVLNVRESFVQSFSFFWQHKTLRLIVIYVGIVSFFITGPIGVGLPIYIKNELKESADSLGFLMSSQALGIFLGVVLAGKFSKVGGLSMGITLLIADCIVGIAITFLSLNSQLYISFVLLFLIGLVTGYSQVILITWVQQQASPHMLGRLMSIVMFIVMGLAPLSSVISGYLLIYISTITLFSLAGVSLIITTLLVFISTQIATIDKDEVEFTDMY